MTLFTGRDELALENLRIINARFNRKPRKVPVRGERPAFALGGSAPTLVIAASNSPASTMQKADYICFGNGDDNLLWTTAILRLAAGQGGRLLICEGDYTFSDTVHLAHGGLGTPLRLEGMGQEAARLHMAAAANVDMFSITHDAGQPKYPIEIASLDMDGAAQTSGTPAGIYVGPNGDSSLTLSDVRIHEFQGYGARFDRCARQVFVDRSTFVSNASHGFYAGVEGYFHLTDCDMFTNGGYGISAEGVNLKMKGCVVNENGGGGFSSGGIFESLGAKLLIGNEFTGNTGTGIYLDGVNAAVVGNLLSGNTEHGISALGNEPLTIADNVITGNSQRGAMLTGGSGNQGGVFSGNVVKDNLQHGVYVGGSHWQIISNRIEENGQATNNTYDGIHLEAAADDCEVLLNKIRQAAAGNKQRYGWNVAAGATNNWVAGNRAHGTFGTGLYNDAGTGTITVWAGSLGDNY